jgi:hypothetical protein
MLLDHAKECGKNDWNVSAEIAQVTEPPIAENTFLVKVSVSCAYCGLTLNSIDDGKVMPYLETVMYP